MPATATTSISPAPSSCAQRCRGPRDAMDGTFEMPDRAPGGRVEVARPASTTRSRSRCARAGSAPPRLSLQFESAARGRGRPAGRPARRSTCTSTRKTWTEARDRAAHARCSRSRRRRHDHRPRRLSAVKRACHPGIRAAKIRDPGALHRSTLGAGLAHVGGAGMTRYGRDDSCAMLARMFTGIITDIGELVARREGRFAIRCGYPAAGIAIGASIACDGACLTATDIAPEGSGCVFTVDVSNETLSRTTLGDWQPGQRINLERALQGRRRAGRAYRGRPRRRRRPHRRYATPTAARGASRSRCRVELARLPGAQGLRRARRHLAHRQRGRARAVLASISSPTP